MELHEAIQLIRPAVTASGGTWADYGAGRGIFARALMEILGPHGLVLAIERDANALRALRRLEATVGNARAAIRAIPGDVRNLETVPELAGRRLDGALFGNVLHFLPDAEHVFARAVAKVRPGGRVIIIEYDGVSPNRWQPNPLPINRFFALAESVGLVDAEVVGERQSAYRGKLYCAVAMRLDRDDDSPRARNAARTDLS